MRVFPFRPTGGLDFELNESARNLVLTVLASLFAAMLFFGLREPMTGSGFHRFGDFYALWTSGFICHEGQPALNYDSDALHLRQAMLGMNPLEFNPFPYPPTFLLMLAPFGGLGLGVAFALFMSLTFAFYLWAMTGGNFRSMPRLCGALLAPATTITLVSGQSGYLSGALMLGGLRLAGSRPIVAGVLFGLLAYKPQLGLLLPVALISAGLWRSIASAAATVVVCAVASSWAFGADIWPLWVHQMVYYSGRFDPVNYLMPTIEANALMVGLPVRIALAVQAAVTIPVTIVVWRAFRAGVTERAAALLVVGTFLATPHAFNYDMPMMTAAIVWYFEESLRARRGPTLGDVTMLTLALILPFAMWALGDKGPPISWAPLLLLFVMIARPREALAVLREHRDVAFTVRPAE
jgi:Glycosyltransferase family 87